MWTGIIIIAIIIIIFFLIKSKGLYKNAGEQGERAVSRRIGKTIEGEKYVFNDYRFKSGEQTIQIDHIVVNKNGIFVIETKNYSGSIYGDDVQQEWTQYLGNGNVVNKFYSPVKQNASHVYHLKGFIPNEMGIKSVVVFVQGNIKHINSESVIGLNDIRYFLKSDWGNSLNNMQIERVVKLLKAHEDDTITITEHVENIHKMQDKIDNNICPRCGGKLVLKNGKYGDFYGCENYPKCKFIKKVK